MTATDVRTLEPLAVPTDESSQVMALFSKALDRGEGGVEALGKLVELHERVQRRRAELEFSQALVAFQSNCPPIPRTSTAEIVTKSGTKFSYTYADLEQIVETVRPYLATFGLAFTFDSKADGKTLRCSCLLRHANGHQIVSNFELPTDSGSAMSEQQKVGAALTFAKRQSLVAVLGLTLTDPDPDGSADPTPITAEQEATLLGLIEETGSDPARFRKHFGLREVRDMRASQYAEAVRMLERKRGRP